MSVFIINVVSEIRRTPYRYAIGVRPAEPSLVPGHKIDTAAQTEPHRPHTPRRVKVLSAPLSLGHRSPLLPRRSSTRPRKPDRRGPLVVTSD